MKDNKSVFMINLQMQVIFKAIALFQSQTLSNVPPFFWYHQCSKPYFMPGTGLNTLHTFANLNVIIL